MENTKLPPGVVVPPDSAKEGPRIQTARIESGQLHLLLTGSAPGVSLSVPLENLQRLSGFDEATLAGSMKVAMEGAVILFPAANAELLLDTLFSQGLGIKTARAAALAARAVPSETRAAASRANGSKGGRPRKPTGDAAQTAPGVYATETDLSGRDREGKVSGAAGVRFTETATPRR